MDIEPIRNQLNSYSEPRRIGRLPQAEVFLGVVEQVAGAKGGEGAYQRFFVLDVAKPRGFERALTPFQQLPALDPAELDSVLATALRPAARQEIALALSDLETRIVVGNVDDFLARFDKAFLGTDATWFAFYVGPAGIRDGVPIDVYPDTISPESTPQTLVRVEPIGLPLRAVLGALSRLSHVPDATPQALEGVLQTAGAAVDPVVAVYDVGQGSASALCDRSVRPILYFDFGWPLGFHANTAPPVTPVFCFKNSPSVVLSHWDVDHWNSLPTAGGSWHPAAIAVPWIAPRQFIGPNHLKVANALAARGNLHVWPSALASLDFGNGRVVQCTGPNTFLRTQRNNSGLATYCTPTRPTQLDEAVLLPGDADFTFVPQQSNFVIHGLVGTHHGSAISAAPNASPPAKLALSYGLPKNRYNHPNSGALAMYASAGWSVSTDTAARTMPCCQKPNSPALGNIALQTSTSAQPIAFPLCPTGAGGPCNTCLVH